MFIIEQFPPQGFQGCFSWFLREIADFEVNHVRIWGCKYWFLFMRSWEYDWIHIKVTRWRIFRSIWLVNQSPGQWESPPEIRAYENHQSQPPSPQEMKGKGQVRAEQKKTILFQGKKSAEGWLLPLYAFMKAHLFKRDNPEKNTNFVGGGIITWHVW